MAAYTTINKPTDHFNTKLYTGTGNDNHGITGVGFQPDFTWIKERSSTSSHALWDVIRGVTKKVESDNDQAEGTDATGLKSFDSDGFTLGTSPQVNQNGVTNVAWNWKAGGAGSANSDGDIASTVSVNTTAGFSIVKWTSNGSDSDGIGHGLGVAPKIIIYKRTDGSGPWYYVYKYVDGSLDYLILNDTNAKADLTLGTYGFSTSTTFTNLGFGNTHQLLAYCFAEKRGYSKFGTYTGNGSADGPFVYTGFKPAWVMTKRTDSTSAWQMFDNTRSSFNPTDKRLKADENSAEDTNLAREFLSNGFKIRNSNGTINGAGVSMIYMAFSAESLVDSTGRIPATAR